MPSCAAARGGKGEEKEESEFEMSRRKRASDSSKTCLHQVFQRQPSAPVEFSGHVINQANVAVDYALLCILVVPETLLER